MFILRLYFVKRGVKLSTVLHMGKHTFAGSGLLVQPIIIIPVITYSSLI